MLTTSAHDGKQIENDLDPLSFLTPTEADIGKMRAQEEEMCEEKAWMDVDEDDFDYDDEIENPSDADEYRNMEGFIYPPEEDY